MRIIVWLLLFCCSIGYGQVSEEYYSDKCHYIVANETITVVQSVLTTKTHIYVEYNGEHIRKITVKNINSITLDKLELGFIADNTTYYTNGYRQGILWVDLGDIKQLTVFDDITSKAGRLYFINKIVNEEKK